jgi:hypothetical protein
VKSLLTLVLVLAACEGRKPSEPTREPERKSRVVEAPPSRGVRALPPHAIRADGVGPFKLGATVAALLDQLPSGPRITQFTLPGVIQRDILRAENDAIVIGAEPQGKATFVSVVRGEIARTESGVHVGSTRADLVHALGAPLEELDRAHDPRVVVPSGLKNARVLFDGDRITGFVVLAEERAKSDTKDGSAQRAEIVRYANDEITVLSREEKPIAAPVRVPGLVFAAAVRNPSDGRDEIVAVSKSQTDTSVTWSVVAFRLYDGKLPMVILPTKVYELTDANARWIGADVRDVELYLEVTSRADGIEVGGLLTTASGGRIRDLVVISPVPVPRRRTKPMSHEASDAGIPDAPTPLRP